MKNPVIDWVRGLSWIFEDVVATERVGFEPTEARTSLVFKTRAINHSTTSPGGLTQSLDQAHFKG